MLKSRNVNDLRKDVADNCKVFLELCKKAGLNVLITETIRDNEYQASLYAQGRTKPGSVVTNSKVTTYHGKGLAFDFCKNVKGHEYDDNEFFKKCGEIGKKIGFTWGGDWKSFVDKPHLQWDNKGKSNYTNAPKMPLYKIEEETDDMVYYKTLNDVPSSYKTAIQKAIQKGALKGKPDGTLDLSEDLCRTLTILDRLGVI